jgi:phosphoribosylamine--glycine ligase
MRVGVLGGAGREHALVWKFQHEDMVTEAVWLTEESEAEAAIAADALDLIVVGPEAPLAAGIVDRHRGAKTRIFGPNQHATQLESSKVWAKRFMARHGVATAPFWAFDDLEAAHAFLSDWEGGVVVKYDGLATGKGVTVCPDREEALLALQRLEQQYGADVTVVLEELLIGEELSCMGVTDGQAICLFPLSRDYKRAFDGDFGPNTGGMGAICPIEASLEGIKEQIIAPTLQGLMIEEIDFCGFLYFGIMVTPSGPKLLEYNVRLGNPEAQVILPALASDLIPVITACLEGELSGMQLLFDDQAYAGVVLASKGYPGRYQVGKRISGIDALEPETLLFHSGVKEGADGLVTAGGRVLTVVCSGADLDEAVANTYTECNKIRFDGVHYRRDIGRRMALV